VKKKSIGLQKIMKFTKRVKLKALGGLGETLSTSYKKNLKVNK
jgi:hypothetical protein